MDMYQDLIAAPPPPSEESLRAALALSIRGGARDGGVVQTIGYQGNISV